MHNDIVIPKNNEAEFAEIASKLGIDKLYFLYGQNEFSEDKIREKLDKIKESFNINFEIGVLTKNKDIKLKTKLIAAKSSDKDRYLIESRKVKLIYGFEEIGRKDYLHQRASGLNHIMCELARKNNIIIGFSYNILINSEELQIPIIAGRMRQNITLCQKFKVKTTIASFSENPFDLRAPHDVSSLFKLLGMNERNVKDSLNYNLV